MLLWKTLLFVEGALFRTCFCSADDLLLFALFASEIRLAVSPAGNDGRRWKSDCLDCWWFSLSSDLRSSLLRRVHTVRQQMPHAGALNEPHVGHVRYVHKDFVVDRVVRECSAMNAEVIWHFCTVLIADTKLGCTVNPFAPRKPGSTVYRGRKKCDCGLYPIIGVSDFH